MYSKSTLEDSLRHANSMIARTCELANFSNLIMRDCQMWLKDPCVNSATVGDGVGKWCTVRHTYQARLRQPYTFSVVLWCGRFGGILSALFHIVVIF